MLLTSLLLGCPKVALPPPASPNAPAAILEIEQQVRIKRSVWKAEYAGSWPMRIDVSADGGLLLVEMAGFAPPEVEQACINHWSRSRWSPAYSDGVAVDSLGLQVQCVLTSAS